jgi:hypothetical protein
VIEKLTEEERRWFEGGSAIDPGPTACAKALRIIERLETLLFNLESHCAYLRGIGCYNAAKEIEEVMAESLANEPENGKRNRTPE